MRGTSKSGRSPLNAQTRPHVSSTRIGEDARGRRDPVAGRDMGAGARAVERPVVVGAAQPAVDHLPDRQVGAEMRAPRALHHRLACRHRARRRPGCRGNRGRSRCRPRARPTGTADTRSGGSPPRAAVSCCRASWVLDVTTPMAVLRRNLVLIRYLDFQVLVPISTRVKRRMPAVRRKAAPAAGHPAPIDALPPRRRAILIAAVGVLMEKGYARASTLEIATRARVSKRELYAEFGSKRGILEALIACQPRPRCRCRWCRPRSATATPSPRR